MVPQAVDPSPNWHHWIGFREPFTGDFNLQWEHLHGFKTIVFPHLSQSSDQNNPDAGRSFFHVFPSPVSTCFNHLLNVGSLQENHWVKQTSSAMVPWCNGDRRCLRPSRSSWRSSKRRSPCRRRMNQRASETPTCRFWGLNNSRSWKKPWKKPGLLLKISRCWKEPWKK